MADSPSKLDPNEAVLVEPTGGRPAPPTAPDDRSIGDLLGDLASETTTLVKQEVALAKSEIRQEVRAATDEAKTAAGHAGAIAAGGAVAYTGLIAVVIGLGWLLGELLADAEWLGLVLVGLIVAGVGYALVQSGLKKLKKDLHDLKQIDPTPDRTIKTLKEDKEWLKSETS